MFGTDNELGNNNNEELEQISVPQYSDWLISTWMELVVVEYYGPPLEVVVEEEWQLDTPAFLEEEQNPGVRMPCVRILSRI